jgi:hypothetical protein
MTAIVAGSVGEAGWPWQRRVADESSVARTPLTCVNTDPFHCAFRPAFNERSTT